MKKLIPKLKNLLKLLKELVVLVVVINLKLFYYVKDTRRSGEDFIKRGRCTHGHRSAMTTSAWCDLNKNCTVLKLHDMCHNPICICQKQITFTPQQFLPEGGSIKSKLQKILRGTQSTWNKVLKPSLSMASPYIGMAVSAKTKNPKIGQATAKILKSISGGKILSLTDMHGNGIRLKVM